MALLIDNEIAQSVLKVEDAVEVIENAFSQLGEGNAAFQPRTDILSPVENGGELDYYWWHSLIGATLDPPRLTFRFVSDVYSWQRDNENKLREIQYNVEMGKSMGFVLLFDSSSGEIIGLLNDEALQHARVGATAGVACKYLSKKDSDTVGIIGSGGMARSYLEAFAAVRELSKIYVYSPTKLHREKFSEEMSSVLGVDVIAVKSPDKAVKNADIIATCTNAGSPVFTEDFVSDGVFLVDTKSSEVSIDATLKFDKIIGTTREPYLASEDYVVGPKELLNRHIELHGKSGFQKREYPTLSEIIHKKAIGRNNDEESIYFHNRSTGIQFTAICDLVHRICSEKGLGKEIPLEWFQQDLNRSYS